MRIALQLAVRGQGHVEPNPMVGCLLVHDDQVIGQGYHASFGGPHAEIAALKSLPHLEDARGATAYVTLEPCCHQGKTPPCTKALLEAGIRRVVAATEDPNPSVAGGGLRQLRDAGIETTIGVLQQQADRIMAPYLKWTRQRLPYVIAKWAMTIDGKIATASGQSQWITCEQSRRQVHLLRGRVDAIVVGMGTVRADDPLLTARPAGPRVAKRVVFCRASLPQLDSRLIQSAGEAPIVLVTSPALTESNLQPFRDHGVEIIASADAETMVTDALRQLAADNVTNVLIEGGGKLLASFAQSGQIDECHVYLGPKVFGGDTAPGPIGGQGVLSMDEAIHFDLHSIDRFDSDVRLVYRRR